MILAIIIAFIAGALFGIATIAVLSMSYDKYEDSENNGSSRKRDRR